MDENGGGKRRADEGGQSGRTSKTSHQSQDFTLLTELRTRTISRAAKPTAPCRRAKTCRSVSAKGLMDGKENHSIANRTREKGSAPTASCGQRPSQPLIRLEREKASRTTEPMPRVIKEAIGVTPVPGAGAASSNIVEISAQSVAPLASPSLPSSLLVSTSLGDGNEFLRGDPETCGHHQAAQSPGSRRPDSGVTACFDNAIFIALDQASSGDSWYTSTLDLQLVSLHLCAGCRSVPTVRLFLDGPKTFAMIRKNPQAKTRVPTFQNRGLRTVAWQLEVGWMKSFPEIMRNVEHLIIDDPTNSEVEKTAYPANLKSLQFGSSFNRTVTKNRLPPSVETLIFGHKFNKPVKDVRWPHMLRRLQFGNFFNKPISATVFPASLSSLTFLGSFDQPIDQVLWPINLREVDFGISFNQPLDDVSWPPSLRKITFGFRFKQRLDKIAWPLHLQELVLGRYIPGKIARNSLPVSLQRLTLTLPPDAVLPVYEGVAVSRSWTLWDAKHLSV